MNARKLVYILILIIRIVSALLIFVEPILATILTLFFDAIDGNIASSNVTNKKTYQHIDKALDFFWYFISLLFILTHHQSDSMREIRIVYRAFILCAAIRDAIPKFNQVGF